MFRATRSLSHSGRAGPKEATSDKGKGGRSPSVENAGSLPDSQLVLNLLRGGAWETFMLLYGIRGLTGVCETAWV